MPTTNDERAEAFRRGLHAAVRVVERERDQALRDNRVGEWAVSTRILQDLRTLDGDICSDASDPHAMLPGPTEGNRPTAPQRGTWSGPRDPTARFGS